MKAKVKWKWNENGKQIWNFSEIAMKVKWKWKNFSKTLEKIWKNFWLLTTYSDSLWLVEHRYIGLWARGRGFAELWSLEPAIENNGNLETKIFFDWFLFRITWGGRLCNPKNSNISTFRVRFLSLSFNFNKTAPILLKF